MDEELSSVLELKVTRLGEPKDAVSAFAGIVAARGFAEGSAVTTPNMTWVPKFAIAHGEITTYTDGRCTSIPGGRRGGTATYFTSTASRRSPAPRVPVLCAGEPWAVPTGKDAGFLDAALQDQLLVEAHKAIARYRGRLKTRSGSDQIGHELVVSLRHVIDQLCTIPASWIVIVAVAAHLQRLTLELYGLLEWLDVVMERFSRKDCRTDILEIVGAHTTDPSVAQMLHYAGIPVWFQQAITTHIEVYKVVEAADIPDDFSRICCFPRLVLAKPDLSGALNMPGSAYRAMSEVVRRQLCGAGLPALVVAEADTTPPPAKRLRESAASSGKDSFSLGLATLPSRPVGPAHSLTSDWGKDASRRTKDRATRRVTAAAAAKIPPTTHALVPSRQFYPLRDVAMVDIWATALAKASPVPQPRNPVKYYFPPPWLLESLDGYDSNPNSEKTARFFHQWVTIRTFCRTRLFPGCFTRGGPLTGGEWRHALWGNYDVDDGVARPEAKLHKHLVELKTALRELFGGVALFPSYDPSAKPLKHTMPLSIRVS